MSPTSEPSTDAPRRSRWLSIASSLRGWVTLTLLLELQIGFYVYFVSTKLIIVDLKTLRGFAVALSTITVVTLVNVLLSRLRSRALASALNLIFVGFYSLLLLYRWKRGSPLDFALLAANVGELMSALGLKLLGESGGGVVWTIFALVLAGLVALELRFRVLSTFPRFRRPWRAAAALVLTNGLCFLGWHVPNELLLFVRSVGRYALHPFDEELRHVDTKERFPWYREPEQAPPVFPPDRRPHVFVVLMESFSVDFVEKRDPAGRPITPFFDSLIPRGAYHELFFANSMQSERGQCAALCSIIPSYRRKVMVSYIDHHFVCLPELMRSAGYETIWAQAQPDIRFDNVDRFMAKIGFNRVISTNDPIMTADERTRWEWGWGVQDDIFFREFFEHLDTVKTDRPWFAVLATISHHMTFDAMPASERRLYPEPATFQEQFLNSQHLADAYLRAFFEELERRDHLRDSLVILLGDHGYPAGQHGVTSNEVSYYNELFRVPFLVLGPRVEPFRNATIAYSQLDIAPTLARWLGVARANAFTGVPMPFRSEDVPTEQHWIPLIQPYDGTYLVSMRYPYKYVKNVTSSEVLLFDLKSDPEEKTNLAPGWGSREPLPELAAELSRIYLNQRLLDEDRLIPH